jgi:hypothetical protein
MATLASAPAVEPQPAAPPGARVAPEQLSRSIEEVLDKREYLWRLPREQGETNPSAKKGLLARFVEGLNQSIETSFKTAHRWVQRVGDAWNRLWKWRRGGGSTPGDWLAHAGCAILLLVALAALIGWVMVRLARRHGSSGRRASPVPAVRMSRMKTSVRTSCPDGWIQLGRG